MTDMTMCYGTNCPKKESCYRHTCLPSRLQAYFKESPIKDGSCVFFEPIEKKEKKNETV